MIQQAMLDEKFQTAIAEPPPEKLAIERILCPVDFSEFSRQAFRYAVSLARHWGAHLYIQHTAQPPTYLFVEGAPPTAVQEYVQSELSQARHVISEMLQSAGVNPSEVTLVLKEGDARIRIPEAISEERIDLLVMGTHGRKGFNRLVLGSVAERMIHQATCPVLVVSRPERDLIRPGAWDPVELRTILFATDFSRASDRALTYALRWAEEWKGKVIAFHAVEAVPRALQGRVDLFPEYNPSFEKQIAEAWEKMRHLVVQTKSGSVYSLNRESMTWRRIEKGARSPAMKTEAGRLLEWPGVQAGERMTLLYAPFQQGSPPRTIRTSPVIAETAPQDCEVVYEVRHGNPKEEIPRVAEEKEADLIIVGARGSGGSALPWGSVSSAVVRDGRFPVLVVRDLPA